MINSIGRVVVVVVVLRGQLLRFQETRYVFTRGSNHPVIVVRKSRSGSRRLQPPSYEENLYKFIEINLIPLEDERETTVEQISLNVFSYRYPSRSKHRSKPNRSPDPVVTQPRPIWRGVKSIFSDSNMEIRIQIYGNVFPADKPDKPRIRPDILMPSNRRDQGTKSFRD